MLLYCQSEADQQRKAVERLKLHTLETGQCKFSSQRLKPGMGSLIKRILSDYKDSLPTEWPVPSQLNTEVVQMCRLRRHNYPQSTKPQLVWTISNNIRPLCWRK